LERVFCDNPELLSGVRKVAEFVNADVIQTQAGVSEIEAARITLGRLDALAQARKDMAFETTLASHLLLPRVRRMQIAGYRFHLFFSGCRGLENFFRDYLGIADTWQFVDNTAPPPGRLIACQDFGTEAQILDDRIWNRLAARYMKPRAEEPRPAVAEEVSWTSQDILDAVNRAVTKALRRHKERGESVVIWRDGKIVTLKPEEIDV